MCALYTFLRIADDIADEPGERAAQRTGLVAWREGLNDAVHGTYSHPCHAALHHTIQQFDIPPSLLHAVIDGVAMDLSPQRFNTFAELYQYCYRVASAVGLASIRIWDCADPVAEEFAEASGIAFQLTNILRDVAADAQAGRCYIPQEDLRRFDCTEAQLRDGPWNDRYQALVQFEADRAREYYANAEPLAALLPPPGRAVFQIMTRIYRGLLEELTRTTFRRDGGVVRLSAWRKIAFVLQALPIRFGWT
jgi:phytoene synthase